MAAQQLVEQVGRVLDGRYRVTAPIGTGASAAVFLAEDVVLRRRVAIKVLHQGLAHDEAFLRRFQAEARTAASLSNPNIMRVLDWGETNEGPFLVLEYLGGGSLRAVLDRCHTLSLSQTAKVGLQAARALDHAHRRGLVHRDIKPGNLLFDDEERLAVADFGLARALAEAAMTEPGGAMLGTARYASPEQVRGKSLDGKSDVYALGLMLIETMTGTVPFTADTTLATLMARLDVQLTAPPEMGVLGEIVEKATAPDPEERIDSATLVKMLESAVAQLPPAAPIPLPGAVSIDLTEGDHLDRTMLPSGSSSGVAGAAAAGAVPAVEGGRASRLSRNKKAQAEGNTKSQVQVEESAKRSRKPRARTVVRAFLAALLIAILAGGGYALYYFTGTQRPVPQLNGMTLDEAKSAAETAGITLSYDGEVFSEDIPVGLTLQQTPDEGSEVYPRERVHVRTSKGPAPRPVVDFVGKKVDEARDTLTKAAFNVVVENKHDENIASGQVLDQQPRNGEQPKGSQVKLIVSSGPAPRVVPDVAGMSYEEAAAAITSKGLRVSRADAFSDNIPVGQVAGSRPGPGASAARDSVVAINVSKGPDLITVPNVGGVSVTSATSTLQAAGFSVNNVYGPPSGQVFSTSPNTGTKAKRGASVALYTR